MSAPRVALAEWWASDDPRLPVGCRRARDALADRGRRVGVLHTVALLPTGELDERISVQSPGGVFLVWRRSGRGWTGSAILNAWRELPVKMTVTKAMQIINGSDRV